MLVHAPGGDTDCWGNNPAGHSPSGSTSNWDNLALLLKAGIAGVREVDPTIQIMLHTENTDDLAGVRWWVQNARDRDVDFDILGLSAYTAFQGPPATWKNTFDAMATEFPELSFVIAEYNPERTAANQVMLDLPDARGLGTFFWEPTEGGEWGDAMFSWQGNSAVANPEDFAEYDQIKSLVGL
jgi:arabinogalactan endo-1,4-beta-galactosidase